MGGWGRASVCLSPAASDRRTDSCPYLVPAEDELLPKPQLVLARLRHGLEREERREAVVLRKLALPLLLCWCWCGGGHRRRLRLRRVRKRARAMTIILDLEIGSSTTGAGSKSIGRGRACLGVGGVAVGRDRSVGVSGSQSNRGCLNPPHPPQLAGSRCWVVGDFAGGVSPNGQPPPRVFWEAPP